MLTVVLAAAGAVGLVPHGTSPSSLAVRAVLGLGLGAAVVLGVSRSMRSLANPPPAAPPRVDATPIDVVYECASCGTRLRLEVAATGKPPRHCGEEMAPKVSPGR